MSKSVQYLFFLSLCIRVPVSEWTNKHLFFLMSTVLVGDHPQERGGYIVQMMSGLLARSTLMDTVHLSSNLSPEFRSSFPVS